MTATPPPGSTELCGPCDGSSQQTPDCLDRSCPLLVWIGNELHDADTELDRQAEQRLIDALDHTDLKPLDPNPPL